MEDLIVIQIDKINNEEQKVDFNFAVERLGYWYNGKTKARELLLNGDLLQTPYFYYQIQVNQN